MKFTCNICNYSTDTKFCYEKHLNTKKHKEKVNEKEISPIIDHNLTMIHPQKNQFICIFCDNKYTTIGHLNRHNISCIKKRKIVDELNKKIAELTEKVNEQAKIINHDNEIINKKNEIIIQKEEKCNGKVTEKVNNVDFCPSIDPQKTINQSHKNQFICIFCDNKYTTIGHLNRHKNACFEKRKLIDELNKKDEMLNQKDELLNQKDEMISAIKSEVSHLKLIVNNSGSIIKTSVSTMAYVLKNYKEAPLLESPKDYSALHFEQNNTEFVDNLIYEHNHNKLHIYIGDFIIKTYKKENPSQQSIWNSDTSRLTYLVREIITNNKVDWKVDKKGIKTTEFIINPILKYIDDQVTDYIQTFDMDYSSDSAISAERKMLKLKAGTEILKSIEDKVLNEAVLKHIAPYFYLCKTDDTIED